MLAVLLDKPSLSMYNECILVVWESYWFWFVEQFDVMIAVSSVRVSRLYSGRKQLSLWLSHSQLVH